MKKKVRLIARLDIKAPNVVKGIHMEGLKKIGNPNDFAKYYYEQGADEILCIDIVASLYNRNSLLDIVYQTTANVFVPIIVGGGIRSVDDARQLLRAGADKIAVNTAAIKNPRLITELAQAFGSQCVVVSIHAKKKSNNNWEAYYDCGREATGINIIDWVKQVEMLGAGEILITSIDRDGTQLGCDLSLAKAVTNLVSIPIIIGGGIGCLEDINNVIQESFPDAVAMGSALHFNKFSIQDIRNKFQNTNINLRTII